MIILYSLAFLLGDVYLQSMSVLPSFYLCSFILILSCIMSLILKRYTASYLWPIIFAAGFVWTTYTTHTMTLWSLPHEMEGQPLVLTGIVASLVNTDETGQHFNFYTDINYPVLMRLSWRQFKIALKPGDVWRIKVKLKRIHGTHNPGGFDLEKWALEERLRATGYVLDDAKNTYIYHLNYKYVFAQVRQSLQFLIKASLPHSSMLPWVMALTTGDRGNVRHEDWEVLRKTGTNHLMAIAGLHIGLVALAAKYLVGLCWRLSPRLILMLPVIEAEACAALLSGLLYAGLAGFSLPARRACFMLLVYVVATLCRRKINSWAVWSLAMCAVLLIDPLAVLSDSFWLSFVTIALVIYGMHGRVGDHSIWWKWCRIQWVIGFGLIPLTLYFYRECSIVSLLANSITIPFLAIFVLPACLLSTIFIFFIPPVGHLLLLLADMLLRILWMILSWFAALPYSSVHLAVPDWPLLLTSMLAVVILLLPAGLPGRWLGLVWCLPLILFMPSQPVKGEVWLTVLDVGQGLSAVIKTRNHIAVYDVGPKLSDKMDSGENIIVPYLQLDNRKNIDALIVSHGDNDHLGGASALLKAFHVRQIYTSVPEKLKASAQYCLAGQHWNWDGVNFAFIYPTADMLHRVNDSSCVLRIQTGDKTILLPGDIEKAAEVEMLARLPDQLQATVLVAPHHGSKTSGLRGFVASVYPQYVIYATGYHNKYHFPHPDVVASYADINAIQLNTMKTGAITMKLAAGRTLMPPEYYNVIHPHYWMDDANY